MAVSEDSPAVSCSLVPCPRAPTQCLMACPEGILLTSQASRSKTSATLDIDVEIAGLKEMYSQPVFVGSESGLDDLENRNLALMQGISSYGESDQLLTIFY
jgi:hypothetical protein